MCVCIRVAIVRNTLQLIVLETLIIGNPALLRMCVCVYLTHHTLIKYIMADENHQDLTAM